MATVNNQNNEIDAFVDNQTEIEESNFFGEDYDWEPLQHLPIADDHANFVDVIGPQFWGHEQEVKDVQTAYCHNLARLYSTQTSNWTMKTVQSFNVSSIWSRLCQCSYEMTFGIAKTLIF